MMRRWLPLAAALIVCVTNVAALGLGLFNRRNPPVGAITLTERELPITNVGAESTATILRIQWTSVDDNGFSCDRIRPLGFTCPTRPVSADRREFRQPARNGYVVLEYDGPAWERLRKRREAEAAEFAARDPAGAAASLNRETHLVAIDVGADPGALRAKYADASRYLITSARIVARDWPPELSGFIVELIPSTINVPFPLSTKVRSAKASHSAEKPETWRPRYTVTLRYGRFLEPWVVDIQP